jgi:hypothetical protein
MKKTPWLWWAVWLLVSGCGADALLTGSMQEVFPLDVSYAEVYRNSEGLQVTYYRNRNVFLDVVARISVYVNDLTVKPGAHIKLDGEYTPGHLRTTVAHAPGGEPVRLLPPLKRGDLTITGGGEPETRTSGDFSMLFDSVGGDLGYGRTLNGSFSAMAKDAGFGPLP